MRSNSTILWTFHPLFCSSVGITFSIYPFVITASLKHHFTHFPLFFISQWDFILVVCITCLFIISVLFSSLISLLIPFKDLFFSNYFFTRISTSSCSCLTQLKTGNLSQYPLGFVFRFSMSLEAHLVKIRWLITNIKNVLKTRNSIES